MKKQRCLETAYICGLQTVAEAYANIEIHCMQLFAYAEIDAELRELRAELGDIESEESVVGLLGKERCEALDAEVAATCEGFPYRKAAEFDL